MRKTPILLLTASLSGVALLGNWPDYRGPGRDGVSQVTNLPLRWSETLNVRWKTPIHGRAWSSPVIWEKQVWLTTATENGKELSVLCIDRDSGKILLDRKLFDVAIPRPLSNAVNTYASPSPTIEEGRVYVHFGSYGTACLDTKTFEVLWERRDLPCDHWRGPASSPVLWEDLLFLHMDGADVQYVAALDKTTGFNRWVTFRSVDYGDLEENGRPRMSGDFRKAYNTPLVIEFQGEPQLISPSAKGAYGYDPRTGREIWQIRHGGHSSAPRTLYSDGQVGIGTGYIGSAAQLWGVRLGGRGDVTGTHIAWKYARGAPKHSSPVLAGGRVYMVSNDGIATCLDFKSGQEIWKIRIGGLHSASVLYAGGRIHYFDEDGRTTILQPGETPDILARNQLDDGFMASPAVADGALFLRTKTHLYRIQGR